MTIWRKIWGCWGWTWWFEGSYYPRAHQWVLEGVAARALFYKDVDAADSKFDVNKDVVDGQLVNEVESSMEEEVEKEAAEEEKEAAIAMEGGDNKAE